MHVVLVGPDLVDEVFSIGNPLALLFSAPRSVVVLAGEGVVPTLRGIVLIVCYYALSTRTLDDTGASRKCRHH